MKPGRPRATLRAALIIAAIVAAPAAFADEFGDALLAIQQRWAQAMYATPDAAERRAALDAITQEAAALAARYPERAEPHIWQGIALSTFAAERGGFAALRLAKRARTELETALRIDPGAAAAHTTLGALYLRVPRPPLGFGDMQKASEHLRLALQENPTAIDANFFYGEYLFRTGDHEGAVRHLDQALAAPARPGRELADEGRRREAEELMRRVRKEMGEPPSASD